MASKRIILRNSAKCLKCGDEVESKHVHDFQWCSCKNMAVDGGHWYTKRSVEDFSSYEDTSEFADCPDYIWDTFLVRLPEADWRDVYEKLTKRLKEREEQDRLKREERERQQP